MSSIWAMLASWNSSRGCSGRGAGTGAARWVLLEQLRDEADLLAEVEGPASRQLLLVGVVDEGELRQAQDLQRRAIAHVVRTQGVDRGWSGPERPSGRGCAHRPRSCDAPRGQPPSRPPRGGTRRGMTSARLIVLAPADARPHRQFERRADEEVANELRRARVRPPDRTDPKRDSKAWRSRCTKAAKSSGVDELVLGAVDEGHELVEEPVVGSAAARVVVQRQVAADVEEQEESWPMPSRTSGWAGSPASAADSVRTRWQKL